MSNKSILFVMVNLPIGGAEWVVTNLCNEIVKKDVDVTLLSVKGGELIKKIDSSVNVVTFDGNYRKAFWFIYKSLLSRKFDAVFATQRYASAVLSYLHLLSFSNAKLVIREAASNFGNSLKTYRELKRLFFKISYRRADLIISNSKGTLESLLSERIIMHDERVSIISNPVDIKNIQEKSLEPIAENIDFSRHTLISVGRLVPKKKMDVIIRSIPLIKKCIPDIQLLIVGEGEERVKLENLINVLKLENHVLLLGQKTNPYPYVKRSNQFILASEWEGFGMVVVEALAVGTSVIVTDIDSGPKQIIENGRYGSLVPVDSYDIIAEKVIRNYHMDIDNDILLKRANDFNKNSISDKYYKSIFV